MVEINWLHISDIHIGANGQKYLWADYEDIFYADLNKLLSEVGFIDLILFTGDLTNSALEFNEADKFLNRVIAYLNNKGHNPILLAVPGNHDLVRPEEKSDAYAELFQLKSSLELQDKFWNDKNSYGRKIVGDMFKNYSEWWVKQPAAQNKDNYITGTLPGDFSYTFTKIDSNSKEEVKIGIVGLNSSFLHFYKVSEGNISISQQQFHEAHVDNNGIDWIKKHHACIIMTHHPINWFDSAGQNAFHQIYRSDRFVVHLFGHMHDPNLEIRNLGNGETRRSWQSSSFFSTRKLTINANETLKRKHGYSIGRIKITNHTQGTLCFWPRKMKDDTKNKLFRPDFDSFDLNETASFCCTQEYTFNLLSRIPDTSKLFQPESIKSAKLKDYVSERKKEYSFVAVDQINKIIETLKPKDKPQFYESMYTIVPLPLEYLNGVFLSIIEVKEELLNRIRNEHPNSLEAHIKAAILQCTYLNQPREAFQEAKKIIEMIVSDEDRTKLSNLFMHIWQDLEGMEKDECYAIAQSLIDKESIQAAIFDAADKLRNANPEEALPILEKVKNEDDVEWLQVYANTLMQMKKHPEAVEYLYKAAKKTMAPMLLHKTADIAFQNEIIDTALWCYQKLAEVQPENKYAHSNLAHIYTYILQDYEKAIQEFDILSTLEPDNHTHKLNKAITFTKIGKYEESLTLYNELCKNEKPEKIALLGRAQLLQGMGKSEEAFDSLRYFFNLFNDDDDFLYLYFELGTAAGYEFEANEALQKLLIMSQEGKTNLITAYPKETAVEQARNIFLARFEQLKKIEEQIIKGHLPWVIASQILNTPIYQDWKSRTQQLSWNFDNRVSRAKFSIYATNSIHPQKSPFDTLDLMPLTCPSEGTDIVADITSLITLHRLDMLDTAVQYFSKIFIPTQYNAVELKDTAKLQPHQKSTILHLEKVKESIDNKRITIIGHEELLAKQIKRVDEYSTDEDTRSYRLIDLINPLYKYGFIREKQFELSKKIAKKEPLAGDVFPDLKKDQKIFISYETLGALIELDVFGTALDFFDVVLTSSAVDKIQADVNVVKFQEFTLKDHQDLWKTIRKNPAFHFETVTIPRNEGESDSIDRDISLFAHFLALKKQLPLLVDDRVIQVISFNDKDAPRIPACSTDVFIKQLHGNKKLNNEETLEKLLALMKWRYRFILPSVDMLLTAARQYKANPPGKALREIAEYIHDCITDQGLFAGPENTERKESIAIRFYISWISSIGDFILKLWSDESVPNDSCHKITIWFLEILVTRPPRVFGTLQNIKVFAEIPQHIISRILLNIVDAEKIKRFPHVLKSVREGLYLTNNQYARIVTDIFMSIFTGDKDEVDADKSSKMGSNVRSYFMTQIYDRAFYPDDAINARTAIMLQILQLIEQPEEEFILYVDQGILEDYDHPRRILKTKGPLVAYKIDDDSTKWTVLELPVLLYFTNPEIRKAGLKNFDSLINDGNYLLDYSKTALNRFRDSLQSDEKKKWQPAAVQVVDILENDFILSLQGLKQCLELKSPNNDLFEHFYQKVFHPSIDSLMWLGMTIKNPEAEHDRMGKLIHDVVSKASSLKQVCQVYFIELGHLPLAPEFSVSKIVELWLEEHPDSEIWNELWEWVDETFNPLKTYHACSVFVQNPTLIPDDKFVELWQRILFVIGDFGDIQAKSKNYEFWKIRQDLSKHFAFHLESQLPERSGDVINNAAWWLSNHVAGIFSEDPKENKFYHEQWVGRAMKLSVQSWALSTPRIFPSFLRRMTHTMLTPWGLSLFCLMGKNLSKLNIEQLPDETREKIHQILVNNLFSCFSLPAEPVKNPTYAAELSLFETVKNWLKYTTNEQKEGLETLIQSGVKLDDSKELINYLKIVIDSTKEDQFAVVRALRAKSFTDPDIAEPLWEFFENETIRVKLFKKVDLRLLGDIMESVHMVQLEKQEKWFEKFPHFIVEISDKIIEKDRQEFLFHVVIQSCLAADSTSALKRLLRTETSKPYLQLATEYKAKIENNLKHYSPWLRAKLSAILQVLDAV